MILLPPLLLFLAIGGIYCEDTKQGSDDFHVVLAEALNDIGVNLTAAEQEGITKDSFLDGLSFNWKLPQWPWTDHRNDSKKNRNQKHPEFRTLDGYLYLLIERHARLNKPLPGASYGLPTAVPPSPTPGKLRYIENSGLCETTPGVYQASGYADLTDTEHMWFWFFEARENPSTAPVVIWINGGPGSSSMVSLFDGNGPCSIINNGTEVVFNRNSWNQKVNMLYIDQPIGTGFSYGETTIGTTALAAADFWNMLQIFFSDPKFSEYQSRNLGLWTESYGGHYGPSFAAYFLIQNERIRKGELNGIIINIKTLGIGNGLTDAVYQYEGFVKYADKNPYRELVDIQELIDAKDAFYKGPIPCGIAHRICKQIKDACRILGLNPNDPNQGCPTNQIKSSRTMTATSIVDALKDIATGSGCRSRIIYCQIAKLLSQAGVPRTIIDPFRLMCANAQTFCNGNYWGPLSLIKGDPYYVIDDMNGPSLPPLTPYLDSQDVISKIGAESKFVLASKIVSDNFAESGDLMYSFVENLETVINANVSTIIYNGDADFVVNYSGVEDLIYHLRIKNSKKLPHMVQRDYTVNGEVAGSYTTSGTFSYLRVYGAGHSVPKYGYKNFTAGQVALQMFNQVMFDGKPSST